MFKKLNNGKFNEQYLGEPNVVAPFTTIVNRAKIEANCKVVGPVERVKVNSLVRVHNETGPNGQPVFTSDKEDSRIRVVGASWESTFSSYGTRPRTNIVGDYIEVTFFGTGLNILFSDAFSTQDIRVSVDGTGEGANIFPSGASDILGARNYSSNAILSVVSSLTLDWHTVKIRNNTAITFSFTSFEILNESNELSVLSGSVYKNGYEYILENGLTIPFKPSGYVGSNGARVLSYINPSNGLVEQVFNEVGTPLYLTNSNHSNEAITRIIHWREFGRNRADDFSTLVAANSNRAFTLDDGTTTLTGIGVYSSLERLLPNGLNSYITLTFEGTGLDVTWLCSSTNPEENTIFVDGVDVGVMSTTAVVDQVTKESLCSGLPYGTHTVKILNTVDGNDRWFLDFIIYGAKKPSIPKEYFVLSDHNIMADFVVPNGSDTDDMAVGVNRKTLTREHTYTGSWTLGTVSVISPAGFAFFSNLNGSSVNSTGFCTGVSIRGTTFTDASTVVQIKINGVNATVANFPSMVTSIQGYTAFNNTTGMLNMNGSAAYGSSLNISGLPLGLYKIEMVLTDGNYIYFQTMDFITPISSMNTSIGSNSLRDVREQVISGEPDVQLNYDSNDSTVKRSKNVSQVLFLSTGTHRIYLEDTFIDDDGQAFAASRNYRFIAIRSEYTNSLRHECADNTLTQSNTGPAWIEARGLLQKDLLKE